LKTCAECGYPNDSSEHRCEKCGIRFEEPVLAPAGRGQSHLPLQHPAPYARAATADNPLDFPVISGATAAAVALAPAWRGEVHQRVSRFRERKGLQGSLEFAPAKEAEPASASAGKLIRFPGPAATSGPAATPGSAETENVAVQEFVLPPALRAAPASAPLSASTSVSVTASMPVPAADPIRPPIVPPPVAIWGPPAQRLAASLPEPPPPPLQQAIAFPRMAQLDQLAMLDFPVASVKLRAMAALLDGLIIAVGYAFLFSTYYLAGGRLPLDASLRALLAPLAGAMAILPILYLYLFLTYSKSTPGMEWAGLRLVNFDGRPATRRQRRLRVWASVVSMASILLGYLWATVDDEHLTWHDRMSETCLTVQGS